MMSLNPEILTALRAGGAATALWVIVKFVKFVARPLLSPLRDLPGPKRGSLIFGNIKAIIEAEDSVLQEQWLDEYGPVISYSGFLGVDRLCTLDTRALNHVLSNTTTYQKPEQLRYTLGRLLGEGVLFAEGEAHTRQRKIMNPSFSTGQIRQLTDIFLSKSGDLRNIWLEKAYITGGEITVDGLAWLSRATLDIIGSAGFNYPIQALELGEEGNELVSSFNSVLLNAQQLGFLAVLRGMFPIMRFIKDRRSRQLAEGKAVMQRIGRRLVQEKKQAALEAGALGKRDLSGRDLLSLLVKANLAKDLKDTQKMSDEEVLNQIPTFLIAGHETTSSSTAWALFSLTKYPDMQSKLRKELLSVSTDTPTMEELNALPYLDAIVRETLRIHAVVGSTIRVAVSDDVIPVSKPFKDRKGNVMNEIRIAKGDSIFIPILALNRDKSIWGEDSFEFNPERWSSLPQATATIPGIFPSLFTFIGGPRGCIGYKFAVIEMKAILFTLIRAFEVKLAVPHDQIVKKAALTTRPVIKDELEKGGQLPLLVKPIVGI